MCLLQEWGEARFRGLGRNGTVKVLQRDQIFSGSALKHCKESLSAFRPVP
jgi:hypothetical protein